jgi:hypothetical protein
MASIEKKVTSAILTVIRARREPESDLPLHPAATSAPVRLREALFSDFPAVAQLKHRWGMTPDSLENWERLWRLNPALKEQCERPIGWVLEAEGGVVGYLGNISQIYRYGERTLTAVTSHGLVVEPGYRRASLSLVAAFYHQKSVDLYLTTTAIEAAGKIARAFGSPPLPQADYDTVLFWVLQPYPFAEVVMKKLELRPTLSRVGGVLASLAIGGDRILRRRRPRSNPTGLSVSEIGVSDIGTDFQRLWEQKLNEKPRLLADRSPAALRWHFQMPGDRGTVSVLCCRESGELLGYVVVRNEPPNEATGLRRSMAADMLAKQDDPRILTALLDAAYDQAERAGSHVFEILGFPENVRTLCSQWHPYERKYPACPFYYKASDDTLHKLLSDGLLWYATPFDGDTTLFNHGTAT